MSTSLMIRRDVTDNVLKLVREVAPIMHESRLFGVSSPAQAAAIILKGHELGLGFTASFEFIHVIQGKPTLSPRGALAILHNAPEIESIKTRRLTDEKGNFTGYECTMKRRNGFEYTTSFTLEDAKRAGLIKKDSAWEHYPERMCLWRVMGFVADVVAPDIIGGLKRADEFGAAIDFDGNVIEGSWAMSSEPSPDPDHNTILAALVEQYTADVVIAANGGAIPSTPEEVATVAEKLAEQEVNHETAK